MTSSRYTCVDCLTGLSQLPPASVPLVIADIPYNIGVDYDQHADDMPTDAYLAWLRPRFAAIRRVLTTGGSFWLFINDEHVSEVDVLAKSLGFLKRSHIIWHYTFGQNCTSKLSRSHTHILYLTQIKGPAGLCFNRDTVLVPSMRQLEYGDKRAASKGKVPDDTWVLNPRYWPGGFPADSDTWEASRVCGTFNEKSSTPNQLPEALLGRIIRLASHPGETVLDPFAGSASALCTAKKLGRGYIGFDISQSYVDAGNIRLNSVSPGDSLFGEKKAG